MTLPEIVLPKVVLPFDIPVLLHPFVVHFLVAIPVVILLLELMNLIMKKKAVGGVSFFLIVLTVFAAIAAYFTGLTDGHDLVLSDVAKTALQEHKLLGTYLLLASALILLLKLLAMTGNKILKGLYILVLIVFVVLLFKQGKEGGALVYTYGFNVAQVKVLDDKIFDLEEVLEEKKNEISTKEIKVESPKVEIPIAVEEEVVPAVVTPAQAAVEATGIETIVPTEEVKVQSPDEVIVIPAAEEIPIPQ